MRKILLPIDCSEMSSSAARCAELIAKRTNASVVLLHVIEVPSHPFELLAPGMGETRTRQQIALDELRAFCRRELSTLDPELRVEEGEPAREIARVADEIRADLLVMPTRGKGPFRRFLLGSTAAKVLNDVPVPVLTTSHVGDQEQICAPAGIAQVLCAADLDDKGKAAVTAAADLATCYGAPLTLLHVLEGGSGAETVQGRERAFEWLRHLAPSAQVLVEPGKPAKVIAETVRKIDADVVVIGRSSPGPLGRLRAQSYDIIRESPCPVLSV